MNQPPFLPKAKFLGWGQRRSDNSAPELSEATLFSKKKDHYADSAKAVQCMQAFGRKHQFWKYASEFLFVNMEAVRTGKLLLDVSIIKIMVNFLSHLL